MRSSGAVTQKREEEPGLSTFVHEKADDVMCSWCPWTPFSAENLMLLYRKQRKMKWLEVMDLDRDILPELKKNEKLQREMFQSVRRLALYPENRETLRLCQFYVQKVAEVLEDLTIHTNFHEYHDPRDPSPHDDFVEARELNDSATAPGLLTRTTFSHMMPFDKCEPLKNLKYLRLHKVNLRYCADTWCKIMDFTKIEHLRVYQCAGADSLFGELSKARSLPKQLKSLEVQHKDNHENETLLALDGFLCLVSGIRELIIDLENVRELPAVAGIVRHGKTLELLNVHGSDYCSSTSITSGPDCADELVYDREDFEKICKACTSLEQLSCAWPFTSLIRVPSEDWKAYERACSGLKEMVTLHISTWPSSTKPSTQRLPRSIYQHLLQGLAQRVFETAESNSNSHSNNPFLIHAEDDSSDAGDTTDPPPSGPSKLHLIAFGISDKIYERVDSKNQILYLRSTCQDAEGRSKAYAAPISWCLRQYIVPHSDILDFVLHREARPPCSLETGFGWNGADDDEYDIEIHVIW